MFDSTNQALEATGKECIWEKKNNDDAKGPVFPPRPKDLWNL